MKFYTGVGSRQTPHEIQKLMTAVAEELRDQGWRLRSGNAEGADIAFQWGAGDEADIFLPWATFGPRPLRGRVYDQPSETAYQIAAGSDGRYFQRTAPGRALVARNVHQILGWDLQTPSRFVICWTPNAEPVGGTGVTIRYAHQRRIPVFNLADPVARGRVERMIEHRRLAV